VRNILISVPGKKEKLPLSVTHPELAKEADGWDPSGVTHGSSKKLGWVCKKKHRWNAPTYSRTKGIGCPYCSGFLAIPGETDLKTTHPAVAKLAFEWDPKTIKAGSNKKMMWRCKKGHLWEAQVYSIAIVGNGCSVCSGHKVLKGFNDLSTTHPHLAKEVVIGDPTTVSSGSEKKFKWRCELGHIFESMVITRVKSASSGCPYCSGLKVLQGFNDLATLNPKLANEADQWDPKTIMAGTHTKKKWKCGMGHKWLASVASRNSGRGCPKCSGREVIIGENDLQTLFPELAKEADGWNPSLVMAGSGKILKWKCSKKHQWSAQVGSRSFDRNGCPYCSNQKTGRGINDLLTTHPQIAEQAYNWDPGSLTSGSQKNVQWICSRKHIWKTTVAHRSKENTGCPYCSGTKAWPGFNDLQTTNPSLAKEAFGWNPTKYTNSSGVKAKWMCSEGHTWTAAIYSRSEGNKTGCPSCSTSGFDPNKKGYFYFLTHRNWQMFQIGITNDPDRRTGQHKKLGWEVLELRGPMDGHLTQQWETAILRMLKAKGADLSNSKIAGKFDGYSEAWSKATFEVKSIKELMRLTEEFEEKESLFNNNQMK
jgi:hypothetical protein